MTKKRDKTISLIEMAGGVPTLAIYFKLTHFAVQAWTNNGIPKKYWKEMLARIPKKHQITAEDFVIADVEIRSK